MTNPPKYQAETQDAPGPWRPRVLILDDEWSTLERIKNFLKQDFEVESASRASQALTAMDRHNFDVVLTDMRMPDTDGLTLVTEMKKRHPESQYILMTAFSDIEDAITALRLGVADYLRKPFTEGEVRHALNRCLEHRRLTREVASLKSGKKHSLADVITSDERMIEICRLAQTAAATDVTVLISGETGTGKGVLARAIHNTSPRSPRPYVEINCASIPATLIESELFGHERGSFTGAVARKIGRVETADGGTLVLDEIGEMPLDMQSKMLRFLQSFNFERVGGTKIRHADVRIIASTNRDLEKAVLEGIFRQDLFYRLNVIHLHIPPLRHRPGDISILADNFLKRFAIKYDRNIKGISPNAMAQLERHDWPGNVRELEHTVERSVILTQGEVIQQFDLPRDSQDLPLPEINMPPDGQWESSTQSLADFMGSCERLYLESILRKHHGKIGESAKAAGINPKTLYMKMNRHGLRRQDFRPQHIQS
ncbi:sigma-54-dependent transcriptional regulator [Dethiosulfatarculus sandiegensis]|uniref:Acetoacetate metabolism regulatory protein AtoC n=1 Tax=Dethiosulfatarculus sandiegensis TaxID=1429043 RepID=A0A0D2JPU0_9BACT|nr:sigma-54 dependent transcriptional regulator [Dethiosulfatarculus sandiegensis]KIX11480.1 acetoacetate metabolism regulatory protein AtoC [Dethiosulfatarculus sandiegensis]